MHVLHVQKHSNNKVIYRHINEQYIPVFVDCIQTELQSNRSGIKDFGTYPCLVVIRVISHTKTILRLSKFWRLSVFCNYPSFTVYNLIGERPFTCPVETCSGSFHQLGNLRQHLRSCHVTPTKMHQHSLPSLKYVKNHFYCAICSCQCSSLAVLKSHFIKVCISRFSDN